MRPAEVAELLGTIRQRLLLIRTRAYVCNAALTNQSADIDRDVAVVVMRDIGDEIDRIQEEVSRIGRALHWVANREVKFARALPRELRPDAGGEL
jgi:hypothetical protein